MSGSACRRLLCMKPLSMRYFLWMIQSLSESWHFLGFVHDASGQCIIDVPSPISSQTGRNSGISNTKVRLQTEHGRFDVFVCSLKDTLQKESGALPLGCKMRLVPRPTIGLLQAMQSRKNRRKQATDAASEQAPILFLGKCNQMLPVS